MIEIITAVNNALNGFIWGVPAMTCIIGVGLYLSFRTGFLQIRKFGYALKNTVGRVFQKTQAAEGSITPFQAVCTALAATVGTGNIAGVAGAITIGGPGSIFWMWICALLGMVVKFAEATLAVHYRRKIVAVAAVMAMMMMMADSHSFSLMRMNWKVKMKGTIQGVRISQER